MKKVVLFALIAALCAGALLYIYLGKLENQKEVPVVYENVVVAAQDIPAFTPLTAEMVSIKQVPQGTSHPLAARTAAEVVGYVTESGIVEGEEILPVKLKQPGQTESGLSYIVPTGMRAVTIAVDEISGLAGFLQRGDYVDVLAFVSVEMLSYNGMDPAVYKAATGLDAPPEELTTSTENATVVVAQNICVAAVGTTLSSSAAASGQDGEITYKSVTLFLTPEDAMRITQCGKSGSLTLVLRASGDHERNTEPAIISNQLLEQAK